VSGSGARQTIRVCTTADGVNIAYARAGGGPPLVLAPSWFTHLQFNWESAAWRHWNAAFTERHTLIRYDPRGCGLSDRDVADLSFEGWVRDLEAVADSLDIERFPIMGFCQGAAVALAYAARHPERVSRLILYGSYPQGIYVAGDADAVRLARSMAEMIRQGWGVDTPAYQELFARLLMPEGNSEQVGWLCEQQRRSTSAATAAELFDMFQSIDVSGIAPQVPHPALVVHQRHDAMIPFANGQRMAALLPNARLLPLEGRNHMILPDEPAWEVFVTEVREFLAQDRPGADGALAALTERERAVLERIARGLTNEEIARALALSEKTVRNHITSIFAKLDVKHRAQAIVMARDAGLGGA